MLLKQDSFGCLAYASYLIADEATGTAVVADPQRAIEQCLHKTMQHSWHIDYVFLTHIHANFLAGHIELQSRVGATICRGHRPRQILPSHPLRMERPSHSDTSDSNSWRRQGTRRRRSPGRCDSAAGTRIARETTEICID